MTTATNGRSVSGCVRYTGSLLRDVASMLATAEKMLGSHGYWPLRGNKQAVWVSDSFADPELWLPTVVYRGYAKLADPKALDLVPEIRIIEVHLAPSFAADPVVLTAKVELKAPADRRQAWDEWSDYIGSLLAGTQIPDTPVTLEGDIASKAHGGAQRIVLRVQPLGTIPDEEAVRTRLVDVILAL